MPFNVLQSVMILLITVSLVSLTLPWAIETIGESMDMVEVGNIKTQFDACSDRILETARTGTTNKCFFNINRGEIIGRIEGISYNIVSAAMLCDPHPFTEIDERKHIFQECSTTGKYRNFVMTWTFPVELEVSGSGLSGTKSMGDSPAGSISFGSGDILFRTVSVYIAFEYTPGESGNIVELSRTAVTGDNVTLSVRMY